MSLYKNILVKSTVNFNDWLYMMLLKRPKELENWNIFKYTRSCLFEKKEAIANKQKEHTPKKTQKKHLETLQIW